MLPGGKQKKGDVKMKYNDVVRKMKRSAALGMTAIMAFSGMGVPTEARAAEQDLYPNEIRFPISILDFREDNLLFEYALGTNGNLTL